jgi:hypothetical protein
MDYLVIDAGFKQGKNRNVLFATNDKQEAIKVAKDSGSGVVVIKQNEKNKSEEIICKSQDLIVQTATFSLNLSDKYWLR